MKKQTRKAGDNPLGSIEYVVESRRRGEHATWLVMRADSNAVPRYAQMGLQVTPGSRVVVEAESLRPVGVLDGALEAPPRPAGFNPYFDLPAA